MHGAISYKTLLYTPMDRVHVTYLNTIKDMYRAISYITLIRHLWIESNNNQFKYHKGYAQSYFINNPNYIQQWIESKNNHVTYSNSIKDMYRAISYIIYTNG